MNFKKGTYVIVRLNKRNEIVSVRRSSKGRKDKALRNFVKENRIIERKSRKQNQRMNSTTPPKPVFA